MSQLSREDYIELGLSVPTSPLILWANEQAAAAKGKLERMERRGVTAGYLKEIKALAGSIADLQTTLGKEKALLPPTVAQVQVLREEVLTYCREAKQILKIEFGTSPEIQVKARLGVRTGRLLANLCRELGCLVDVMRENVPKLIWLGVDEAFINSGAELLVNLKEAQIKIIVCVQWGS